MSDYIKYAENYNLVPKRIKNFENWKFNINIYSTSKLNTTKITKLLKKSIISVEIN